MINRRLLFSLSDVASYNLMNEILRQFSQLLRPIYKEFYYTFSLLVATEIKIGLKSGVTFIGGLGMTRC